MNPSKWMPLAAIAMLVTSATSCREWGEQDPPAGNQIKPTLQNIAAYDFEAEEGLDPIEFRLTANPGGNLPEVVEDETKGKVLHLDNGFATISNPLNNVTLQDAVSLTFWMRQPVSVSEGEEAGNASQDISSPLIAFENETANGRLFINANGGINYSAADGEWVENDPASVTTGYITPDEWHYVAVVIGNKGYEWWVDGDRKVSKEIADFDCSKLVRFANNVPVITIGATDNNSEWLLDDLKIYRNSLTSKETARPNISSGGTGDDTPDLSSWMLVGLEDNSTAFWSMWGEYVNLTGDGTIHYDFYNYNGGHTDNWQNWALVLTNGPERGAEGYAEYAYMRADAYGWGSAWEGGTVTSDFDWGTFMSEMDGAFVSLDITRKGSKATVTALITAVDGTQRHYSFEFDGVTGDTLGTFLTCEGSHLLVNPDTLFVGKSYTEGECVTGLTDCSTPWWSAWSPLNKFTGNFKNFGVEFINHTPGNGANWNNWLLICTNGKWIGEDGYAENFVLRSDAFGWGAGWDTGTCTSAFDWDNYVADMKDAKVQVFFSYENGTLKMECHQWKADGTRMPDYFFSTSVASPMGLFFTCELAWLEFFKVGYYPFATINYE